MGINQLQRYIAKRFVVGILGTFVLCSMLVFMIDMVEMLRQSGKYGAVSAWTLIKLVLLRLPAYTEILLAFAVLVGSVATLLLLSRKSELTVMRASGMSVWQFVWPGIVVAFILGVLAVTVYNPAAAKSRAKAERLFAKSFGRESSILKGKGATGWLRQDSVDGQSVISARAVSDRGRSLTQVTVFQFDHNQKFSERIDARSAVLKDGYWRLSNAEVSRVGAQPQTYHTYILSTHLTPERVSDALGTVLSLSFWELPQLIEVAEKAGLSSHGYRIQYQLLLARPFLLIAMVLLAATVSLGSFRSGNIQTMVIVGMLGGFGFFLVLEVSRQLGVAGLAPPVVAVWVPVLAASMVCLAVLLHQEDG